MKNRLMLTLDDVRRIVTGAEAEAAHHGWAVSIAVCDDGGHPLWLQRLDGAAPVSAMIAPEKARAAALTRRPSKTFEDMVNQGRYAALAMPVTPLEGGEPLVIDGVCIGAVGVSGVKPEEDAQVARAGIEALAVEPQAKVA